MYSRCDARLRCCTVTRPRASCQPLRNCRHQVQSFSSFHGVIVNADAGVSRGRACNRSDCGVLTLRHFLCDFQERGPRGTPRATGMWGSGATASLTGKARTTTPRGRDTKGSLTVASATEEELTTTPTATGEMKDQNRVAPQHSTAHVATPLLMLRLSSSKGTLVDQIVKP